jgi:hypothetical protein
MVDWAETQELSSKQPIVYELVYELLVGSILRH